MSEMIPSINNGKKSGSLYDVVELIIDRGLVIDLFARVSLVGIEVLTVDARVVVASVDTYLRFAEACGRVQLSGSSQLSSSSQLSGSSELPGIVGQMAGPMRAPFAPSKAREG
jgi:hypothetical protein